MRRTQALLCAALLAPLPAGATPLMQAVRGDQWAEAETLAAAEPGPLAKKLVLYYRLLAPGAASAADIAAFMAQNPTWPNQALLSRRLQDALADDKDGRTVLAICRQQQPQAIPSLLRCADAESAAGKPSAEAAARRAWVTGITDPPSEAAFLARWSLQLRPEDQWARFDRLAWSGTPAASGVMARQLARLSPPQRAAALARLALRADAATAPAQFHALPRAAQDDPATVLELARWYRRAGQDHDAAQVWTGPGVAAEHAAPPSQQAAFWSERNRLARGLLRANEPALAYAVAAAPAATREARLDQAFLAGWIALRKLAQPAQAIPHFAALERLSPAAITQGRAHYWLARAQAAAGDPTAARSEFQAAAAWPTTYYGQLAALAGGDTPQALAASIRAAHDPEWDTEAALSFLDQDLARAAILLTAWGEPRRAKAFLQRLDDLAPNPAARALAARFALELGLPEQAVAIARRAGGTGLMLPAAGWPAAFAPPDDALEPGIALGIMRQESSFDPEALSRSGARGLMQLMPATATEVAGKLGLPVSIPTLTADPAYNMRLGTTYLAALLTRFDGALPLAIAAYNAGPNRVADWLIGNPDPTASPGDMIDWIEQIPFDETRNYVQRVIENIVIYRARLRIAAPNPVNVQGARQ